MIPFKNLLDFIVKRANYVYINAFSYKFDVINEKYDKDSLYQEFMDTLRQTIMGMIISKDQYTNFAMSLADIIDDDSKDIVGHVILDARISQHSFNNGPDGYYVIINNKIQFINNQNQEVISKHVTTGLYRNMTMNSNLEWSNDTDESMANSIYKKVKASYKWIKNSEVTLEIKKK